MLLAVKKTPAAHAAQEVNANAVTLAPAPAASAQLTTVPVAAKRMSAALVVHRKLAALAVQVESVSVVPPAKAPTALVLKVAVLQLLLSEQSP